MATMEKNKLECNNKNRKKLRNYSNPYENVTFDPYDFNNNIKIDDSVLKEADSFQIKKQEPKDESEDIKNDFEKYIRRVL